VLFCHASPRRDDEMVVVDSPPSRWADVLAGVGPRTVCCGHTHMQFDRLAAGHRVVNPGSVGMPYGQVGAAWAMISPDVTLRHTHYDTAAAAELIGAGQYPGAADWARDYVLSHYSDTEALDAFTTIARQQSGGA
jgi:hypothetical protein